MKRVFMLALAGALHPCMLHAAQESIRITGGLLGPTEPLPVFTAKRDRLLVTGLPAGWSDGAGACHTAALGQYKALRFNFNDGNTSARKLEAAGYALIGSTFPIDQTMVTLCRDAQGNVQTLSAQIGLLKGQGGGIEIYSVYANNSPTTGASASSLGYLQGGNSQTFTAYSSTRNKVVVKH